MYCDTVLSIGTETIFLLGGFVINLGLLWLAFATFKRSISKDNAATLKQKADEEDLRKVEKDMNYKIECAEKRNRDDYHREIDQLQIFINQRFEEQSRLIRDILNKGK